MDDDVVEMRFTFHLIRWLRRWKSDVVVSERMCCQGEELAGGVRAIKENWAANGQANDLPSLHSLLYV
jgi:hypothetical protein